MSNFSKIVRISSLGMNNSPIQCFIKQNIIFLKPELLEFKKLTKKSMQEKQPRELATHVRWVFVQLIYRFKY